MPYTIKKGEKISDIVDKLDIPYSMIVRYNHFVQSKEEVYEGRTLILPRHYNVLPGDTYKSIGEANHVIPAYMKELNPFIDSSSSAVYPGMTVFLPPR